jgi:hypothetical protein
MTLRALTCVVVALAASAGPACAQAVSETHPVPESPAPSPTRLERAQQNYLAVGNGHRDLTELSREEVEDLIELHRLIRAQKRDDRSPRERCLDEELDGLGRAPSALALRTIDLKCSQR